MKLALNVHLQLVFKLDTSHANSVTLHAHQFHKSFHASHREYGIEGRSESWACKNGTETRLGDSLLSLCTERDEIGHSTKLPNRIMIPYFTQIRLGYRKTMIFISCSRIIPKSAFRWKTTYNLPQNNNEHWNCSVALAFNYHRIALKNKGFQLRSYCSYRVMIH